MKEDEYLRDGVTEDIITELSKIKGLKILSRPTVLPYRDKSVTAAQVGQQLKAAFVLTGSIRRAGNRLRISSQLVDAGTDSLVWSERYDREMADVFEVQDEIARKIAEALRVTLSPQEQQAIAAKPTENLQAYDLYLRGRSYARRRTRQDMEFALQMFESAVATDPEFALAHAAVANVCAQYHFDYERTPKWIERAVAAGRARQRPGRGPARGPGRRSLGGLRRGPVRRGRDAHPQGDRFRARTARGPTTCSAARCSARGAFRKWPRWPKPPSSPPARTTTCTSRS